MQITVSGLVTVRQISIQWTLLEVDSEGSCMHVEKQVLRAETTAFLPPLI